MQLAIIPAACTDASAISHRPSCSGWQLREPLAEVEAIDGEALAEVELVGGGALDAGVERERVATLGARGGLGGGDHGGADAAGARGGRRHQVVHVQHLAVEGLPQHSPADDADAGELGFAAANAAAAAHIALRCLDLENAVQVNEASAIRFLPGMSSLIALNASGTTIGTRFIEFATYGLRLRMWQCEQGKASCRTIYCVGYASSDEPAESYWPLCRLEYLSLAKAPVHPSSVSHLLGKRAACFLNVQGFKGELCCTATPETKELLTSIGVMVIAALKNLVLLDVRQTDVTGRALQPLRALLNLVAVPDNAKLLARSSAVLMSHLQGACGCTALGWASARLMDNNERKQANAQSSGWISTWEQQGAEQILMHGATLLL
eukprot:SM000069S20673  [mRNA]  locus=s69:39403:41894:- [translate_table: standard]